MERRRRLIFASEAKAVLAAPGVSTELDHDALRSYLALGYVAAPQSMFRGVRKLPPATLLIAQDGQVEERRYWRIPADVDRVRSEDEWISLVRARMEESVRMQMVSDVPIGAFLSGGVDSSAVVAFMAAHSDRPVKTYAIGFDGRRGRGLLQRAAVCPPCRQAVPHRASRDHGASGRRVAAPKLLWHMDEPIADTAFVTTYLVSEFARRDVTVILSGVGGDELFGGYRRYLGNHYQARFDRIPSWLRRAAMAMGERLPSDRHSPLLNALRLAKGFLSSAGLPLEERYRSYVQVFGSTSGRAAAGQHRPRRSIRSPAFALTRQRRRLNRHARCRRGDAACRTTLLLAHRQDEHGGLARVPRAAARPRAGRARRAHAGGGQDPRRALKHAMKAALRDVLLPRDILERKKRGFGTPMGAWLKGELAPMVRELLSEDAVKGRGLFRPAEVSALIEAHRSNRLDGTDSLLALLNLELWSRMYLDGRTSSTSPMS